MNFGFERNQYEEELNLSKQTFYRDKPYTFVPFVKKDKGKDSDNRLKAIKGECGTLKITLNVITPLHFSQGDLVTDLNSQKGKFVHILTRQNGEIALPGSSFKGMLRSVFEAISNSCILVRLNNHFLQDAYPVGTEGCKSNTKICPACSVFGKFGQKGKLVVTSFTPEEEPKICNYVIPQLQSPFSDFPKHNSNSKHKVPEGGGNERLYYGDFQDIHGTNIANMTFEEFFTMKDKKTKQNKSFYGRKFYKHSKCIVQGNDSIGNTYECLEVGNKLSGFIHYEGLDENELSILAFALGLGWDKKIYHKIGYAKPAYFGSIEIEVSAEPPKTRYEGIGTYRNVDDLNILAKNYRRNAKGDLEKAILALEEVWATIGTTSQWKESEQNNNVTY